MIILIPIVALVVIPIGAAMLGRWLGKRDQRRDYR